MASQTMSLTTADLKQVRALLHKVRDKWYDIGIELEIDVEELNIINGKFDDPGDKLVQMLIVWLKKFDPPPTWSSLAKALMAEAIHEIPIAEEASALEIAVPIPPGLNPPTRTPPPPSPSALHDQASRDYDLSTGQRGDNGARVSESHTQEESASPSIGVRSSIPPLWKTRGICSHASYHGVMSREEAEAKLMIQNTDCYLTRYSQTREQFALSVRRKRGTFQTIDINIEKDSEGKVTHEIFGTKEKFTSIGTLLDFYKEHPLNPQIDGIGEELVNKEKNTSSVDYRDDSPKPSVQSNLYPCLLQKQTNGEVAFVSKETGKSFLDSSDFMNYCENEGIALEEGSAFVEKPVPVPNSKIHYRKLVSREALNMGVPSHLTIAMRNHPSFHGSITRVDATTILLQNRRKCYLTRYSVYHETCVISVLRPTEDGELLQHFKLDITTRQDMTTYKISSSPKTFDSIIKLLDNYQKNPISGKIDSLGECVECKFPRLPRTRYSSMDLMGSHSGTLNRVTEEEEYLQEEGTAAMQAASSDCETLKEEGKNIKREEIVARAVPDWKIMEIGKLSCFHTYLDMDEAESRLKKAGKDCCYLMRYSESREEHILSVLRKKNEDDFMFQHFPVAVWDEGQPAVSYEILGSVKRFNSIATLLEFYKSNPLNHKIHTIGDAIERDIEDYPLQKISKEDVSPTEINMRVEDQDSAVPQWALTAMESHPSFHGSISRQEAVKKLIESARTCYLTRYSHYNKFCVISMLNWSERGELLQHLELQIPRDNSKKVYKVAGKDTEFDSISKLLEYYQKHPINQTDCLGEHLEYLIDVDLDNSSEAAQEEMRFPTRENLTCITYQDREGKIKDFRLLELVKDRWRRAAVLLAFYKDRRGSDAECCKQIFYKWIRKDGRKDYPLTWTGLHRLLFDMGKRLVAEKLYTVLQYREIEYVDIMNKL